MQFLFHRKGINDDRCLGQPACHFSSDSLRGIKSSEENGYFWRTVNHAVVLQLLRRYFVSNVGSFLDIGCGTGSLFHLLKQYYPTATFTGVDVLPETITYCQQETPFAHVFLHDMDQLPLPRGRTYDVITFLDVLEHLEHPKIVLKNLHASLSENSLVIATVPASPSLWSARDVLVGHKRRYRVFELQELFEQSGYSVLQCGPFFSYLFPLALMLRRLLYPLLRFKGRKVEDVETKIIPGLNAFLAATGLMESAIATRIRLPFGTSLFCVAQPNSSH